MIEYDFIPKANIGPPDFFFFFFFFACIFPGVEEKLAEVQYWVWHHKTFSQQDSIAKVTGIDEGSDSEVLDFELAEPTESNVNKRLNSSIS